MLLDLSTAVSAFILVVLIIREIRIKWRHSSTKIDELGEQWKFPDPSDPLS